MTVAEALVQNTVTVRTVHRSNIETYFTKEKYE